MTLTINVAATRAKKRFYMIGDMNVWSSCEPVAKAKEITDCVLTVSELDDLLRCNEPGPAAQTAVKKEVPPTAAELRRKDTVDRLMICPKCGSTIREFTNRNTGQKFWGCSDFKNCGFKPKCQKCGKPMVIRTKHDTGEKFWGCTGWSKDPGGCKFTCAYFTE